MNPNEHKSDLQLYAKATDAHDLFRYIDASDVNIECERIRLRKMYEEVGDEELIEKVAADIYQFADNIGLTVQNEALVLEDVLKLKRPIDIGKLSNTYEYWNSESDKYSDYKNVTYITKDTDIRTMQETINKMANCKKVYDQMRCYGFDMEFIDKKLVCMSITNIDGTYVFSSDVLYEGVCNEKLNKFFRSAGNCIFGWGIPNDLVFMKELGFDTSYIVELQHQSRMRRLTVMPLDSMFGVLLDLATRAEDHMVRVPEKMMRLCAMDSWKIYILGMVIPDARYQFDTAYYLQEKYLEDKDSYHTIHSSNIPLPNINFDFKKLVEVEVKLEKMRFNKNKNCTIEDYNEKMGDLVNMKKTIILFERIRNSAYSNLVPLPSESIDLKLMEPGDKSIYLTTTDCNQVLNELLIRKLVTKGWYESIDGKFIYIMSVGNHTISTSKCNRKKECLERATKDALYILAATNVICNYWHIVGLVEDIEDSISVRY